MIFNHKLIYISTVSFLWVKERFDRRGGKQGDKKERKDEEGRRERRERGRQE